MTRKEKEAAYKRAAKNVVETNLTLYYCCANEGLYKREELLIISPLEYWIDLKQTILLSCAEITRLKFEIE